VPHKVSSLQMILHYFERLINGTPRGSLYFRRLGAAPALAADVSAAFASSSKPLQPVEVLPLPAVIEGAAGALQADFANRFIGGGALRGCAVQEEILFAACPECIVSMLAASEMGDAEAIFITGAERFAAHRGYYRTLEFAGPFADRTPIATRARGSLWLSR